MLKLLQRTTGLTQCIHCISIRHVGLRRHHIISKYVRASLVDDSPADTAEAASESSNMHLLISLSSKQKAFKLLQAHPDLYDVELTGWLSFLECYGISKHWFFKLLQLQPQLFVHGSLFTAGRTMSYLQSLGLTTRDISAHVIPKAPELLLLDLETAIQPVVDFLCASPQPGAGSSGSSSRDAAREQQDSSSTSQAVSNSSGPSGPWLDKLCVQPVVAQGLGLSLEQLCSIISRSPRVLLMTVPDIQDRIQFLTSLGFSWDEVRSMLSLNGALLTQPSYQAPVERALHFLTHTCGYDRQDACTLLVACQDLVVFSGPNLERKWRYLEDTIYSEAIRAAARAGVPDIATPVLTSTGTNGGSSSSSSSSASRRQQAQQLLTAAEGARAAVRAYPHALACSLLNELGPRFSYARDHGRLHYLLEYDEASAAVTISLRKLLAPDNGTFVSLVHGDDTEFEQFTRQWRRNEGAKLTVTSNNLNDQSW